MRACRQATTASQMAAHNYQGPDATDENPTTFALHVAALTLRGHERKKTEVPSTARRHKAILLALRETPSRTQGKVEGEHYNLWEPGANRAEGKALLVHSGNQTLAEPEDVTEDVFIIAVRYREKDLIRVGVVYASLDRSVKEVMDEL